MKKKLINIIKATSLGVAMLGLGASQVRADEIRLKDQNQNIFEIKYDQNNLGFAFNGKYFNCQDLENIELNEKIQAMTICQELPDLIQRYEDQKLAKQLKPSIKKLEEVTQKMRKDIIGNYTKQDWEDIGKF